MHGKRWPSTFLVVFTGHCHLYCSFFQHFVNATDDWEDTVTFGNQQHREKHPAHHLLGAFTARVCTPPQGWEEVGASVAEAAARSHRTIAALSLGLSPKFKITWFGQRRHRRQRKWTLSVLRMHPGMSCVTCYIAVSLQTSRGRTTPGATLSSQ